MDIRRIDFSARSLGRSTHFDKVPIRPTLAVGVFALTATLLWVTLASATVPGGTSDTLPLGPRMFQPTVDRIPHMLIPGTTSATPPPTTSTTQPAPLPTGALALVPPAPAAVVVDIGPAAAWAASPGVVCIRDHESGDNYAENTGNGYYGAYQDLLSTWEAAGGTGLPSNALAAVQDEINYRIYLSGGWGQWSTAPGCGL